MLKTHKKLTLLFTSTGNNITIDQCPRDEVFVSGSCATLLTQGPCLIDEVVLLDPETNEVNIFNIL